MSATMNCARGVDLMMDYLEGVLPAGLRASIDAHLAVCPRCVAFAQSYQAGPRMLRDVTRVEAPRGLEERLRALVRRSPGA
jgi:anti-sigma factor RsiW